MHFVTGVVENVDDPLKLGRVQVRLNGLHSDVKVPNMETGEGVSTESLPWATPIQPIQSAALETKGDTPIGLLVGTWVMCMSPTIAYEVVFIMGSIAGVSDINPLALGESTNVVSSKKSGVYTAVDGTKEPSTPFAAKYPFNRVVETPNGIIIETDDTPGSERVHVYHPSGTFIELHPDGVKVEKVVDKSYSVTMSDHNILVKGVINIIAEDNINIQTAKTCNIIAATDVTVSAGAAANVTAGTTAKVSAGTTATVEGSTVNVTASGTANVNGSSVNVKGSSVNVDGTLCNVKGTFVTVKGTAGLVLKGPRKTMSL